jgi:hypothetical protein
MGRGLKAGIGFFLGRILGILVIGIILALFGFYFEIDTRSMLYIFGALTSAFGLFILIFPRFSSKLRILRSCEAGACDECDKHDEDAAAHDCSSCPASGSCPSSSPARERAGIREHGRSILSGTSNRFGSLGVLGVFIMGVIRGATPCLKLILLLPLIISLPFLESLAITSTYALSSSLYPIMGISVAMIIGNFSPRRITKYLVKAGALSMVIIGIYFIYKAWNYTCPAGT